MTPSQLPRSLTSADLRGAYGRELERYPWVHFGTLTSNRPMSEQRAEREVWPQFKHEVTRRLSHPWDFVRVREPFESRPGVHIHFLSLQTEELLSERERYILCQWSQRQLGRLQLLPYNPRRGARDYICKYVVKRQADKWDIRFSPGAARFRGPVVPEPVLPVPECAPERSLDVILRLQGIAPYGQAKRDSSPVAADSQSAESPATSPLARRYGTARQTARPEV